MKKTKIFPTALIFVLGILFSGFSLLSAQAGGMNFSVVVDNVPENHTGEGDSYFELLMEPGMEQEASIQVINLSDEEIILIIHVSTATTENSGVINFGPRLDNRPPDENLIFAMEDLIDIESEVVLAPGEVRTVPLTITMPEEEFDGILAGGISVEQYFTEEELAIADINGMTRNFFVSEIVVLLRQNLRDVRPELVLNHLYATHVSQRNTVRATLQNTEPAFILDMEVRATVTKAGQAEAMARLDWTGMIMAPNSNFDLNIPMEGQRFEPGEYFVDIVVTSQGGTWSFVEGFTISPEAAAVLNEGDVMVDLTPSRFDPLFWVLLGAGVLLVIGVTIFIIIKRRNRESDDVVEDLLLQISEDIDEV